MFGLKLDTKELKNLERDLKVVNIKAIPIATKFTLNKAAFNARQVAQAKIRSSMIERNNWTRGSIRVEQTRTLNIRRQESAVGSTEAYMEIQEFGDTESGVKHGVAIPTGYSAGQEGAQPRTRVPRRANRLINIKISRFAGLGVNRKQRSVRVVQEAVKSGRRFVFLEIGDSGRRKGIFKVVGGSKGTKRGWPIGAKLKMIHNLSHRTIRIPARPWLRPSVEISTRLMSRFYEKALFFQLDRLRTFKRR